MGIKGTNWYGIINNLESPMMMAPWGFFSYLKKAAQLTSNECIIVTVLLGFKLSTDPIVWASVPLLAKHSGIDATNLYRSLKHLAERGLIKIEHGKRGSKHPNRYDLTNILNIIKIEHEKNPHGKKMEPPIVQMESVLKDPYTNHIVKSEVIIKKEPDKLQERGPARFLAMKNSAT